MKLLNCIIQEEFLKSIAGGEGKQPDLPNPIISGSAGANSDLAWGSVSIAVPVTPTDFVGVSTGGNTQSGINGGMVIYVHKF